MTEPLRIESKPKRTGDGTSGAVVRGRCGRVSLEVGHSIVRMLALLEVHRKSRRRILNDFEIHRVSVKTCSYAARPWAHVWVRIAPHHRLQDRDIVRATPDSESGRCSCAAGRETGVNVNGYG